MVGSHARKVRTSVHRWFSRSIVDRDWDFVRLRRRYNRGREGEQVLVAHDSKTTLFHSGFYRLARCCVLAELVIYEDVAKFGLR